MQGMTIKQMNRAQFWDALDVYKQALERGVSSEADKAAFVRASVNVYFASKHVPRKLAALVNRTFRAAQTKGVYE